MSDELPGSELLTSGLADLSQGIESAASLLLVIAGPRLRKHGYPIPVRQAGTSAEERLYQLLLAKHGAAAYVRYNALLERLVSLENALDVLDISARDSLVKP